MRQRYILFLLLGIDALILFFQTTELSISTYEANILYSSFSFLQLITNLSLNLFGHNDFGLRFFMILFHFSSIILLYLISSRYLKCEKDRLWLILVFILLPGSISSALQINSAGLLIFGLFLFIYVYQNFGLRYTYPLIFLYVFIAFYIALVASFFFYC